MYYVVVILVLLVELHFVDLRTVLRGDLIALDLREIPVPHLVKRASHERHRRSTTVNLDIHQILPINFNLHAYSIGSNPPTVKNFRSVFFSFFGRFRSRIPRVVKKNRTKKCDFFFEKSLDNVGTFVVRVPPTPHAKVLAKIVPT